MTPEPSGGRDAGLIRAIGPLAFAAAIVNGVVGAGIFSLPGAIAAAAGAHAALAYLACAAIMAGVVACFAEAGSRIPSSGGSAAYVAAAFGPAAGFVTGLLTWLSAALSAGGISAAFAEQLGGLAPPLAGPLGQAAIILAALGVLTLIHLRGAREAATLVAAGTAVKLIPLVLFALAGAFLARHPHPHAHAPAATADFGRALILALFAFNGMETPIAASGEVSHPHRNVPLALFGAMAFVLALYIGVQLTASGILGPALPGAPTPLAEAAGDFAPAARIAMLGAAAFSMLMWLGSDILGAPRLLFGFARDGVLPAALGRVNRAHVPGPAILVHVAIVVALALTGTFVQLAALSALAAAALYILACAASIVLHRRDTRSTGEPFRVPFLPAFAALGIAGMALMIVSAQPAEIAGLAASVALGFVVYLVGRRVNTSA